MSEKPFDPTKDFVIIESPYAGDVEANVAYAKKAVNDCTRRGEPSYASHLFYPQILDDNNPEQRDLGIEFGLAIGSHAVKTVVYIDRGITPGMEYGIQRAIDEGRPVVYRTIEDSGDYLLK